MVDGTAIRWAMEQCVLHQGIRVAHHDLLPGSVSGENEFAVAKSIRTARLAAVEASAPLPCLTMDDDWINTNDDAIGMDIDYDSDEDERWLWGGLDENGHATSRIERHPNTEGLLSASCTPQLSSRSFEQRVSFRHIVCVSFITRILPRPCTPMPHCRLMPWPCCLMFRIVRVAYLL